MKTILTFDLGTTYFKACLFHAVSGDVLSVSRKAPAISHPQPGLWELSEKDFQETIISLTKDLSASRTAGLYDVAAICFATQTNSFALLDTGGCCLTPFLLWPDGRAKAFAPQLNELCADTSFAATTGIPGLSHEFMAAKILWLQENHSDLWSKTVKICLLGDYLALWLTGEHITEGGAAGLTGLVNIHSLQWFENPIRNLRIPSGCLPSIARAGSMLGKIKDETAQRLSVPNNCAVVLGCLDQYAGAIGAGNCADGGLSETTGTVLATVRCAEGFGDSNRHGVFQGPSFRDGLYYQMVFGDTSANLLEAYRNGLNKDVSFKELDREAEKIAPGADGLRVHPKPATSHLGDIFVGMKDIHTRGHAVRAILEAVAFALKHQVHLLTGGPKPEIIHSIGGAARSRLWLQIKADVLGIPVAAIQCEEPTSLGAAILAVAALENAPLEEIAEKWVREECGKRPDMERHKIYCNLRKVQ